MDGERKLLIFGASARAAAFSALRAGFQPWCADLFADADLRQRAPAMQLPARFPDGFLNLVDVELPGPWLYTGGLENKPFLVQRMARRRQLWGNDRAALLASRSPFAVGMVLSRADVPGPAVWAPTHSFPSIGKRWLIKPLASSGGAGIRFLDPEVVATPLRIDRYYLQEFLEGESRAANFLADGSSARLLGLTRQLVGQRWLHAEPFHYCGSIGPLPLTSDETAAMERAGDALTAGCNLRGLFGVDGIWRRGTLWPVEVNPRYTASVEVVEYATGLQALAWHAHVFEAGTMPRAPAPLAAGVVGKAILFARDSLTFPAKGPWSSILTAPRPVNELPPFADIPPAGTRIECGQPILTFFARATSPGACETALRTIASELDRFLFGF